MKTHDMDYVEDAVARGREMIEQAKAARDADKAHRKSYGQTHPDGKRAKSINVVTQHQPLVGQKLGWIRKEK